MNNSDSVSHKKIQVCQLPKFLDDVVPQCEVEHIEAAQVYFQPVIQLELPNKSVNYVIALCQGPGCVLSPTQQA